MANHLKQDRVDRVNIRTYSCPSPPAMWTIIFLCVFQSWMLEGSFLIDRVCLVSFVFRKTNFTSVQLCLAWYLLADDGRVASEGRERHSVSISGIREGLEIRNKNVNISISGWGSRPYCGNFPFLYSYLQTSCAIHCRRTAGCTGFTYDGKEKVCELGRDDDNEFRDCYANSTFSNGGRLFNEAIKVSKIKMNKISYAWMEKMTNFWKFSLHFESFLWWKKYNICFDHPPHILHLFFFEGFLCSFPCFISFTGCGPWRRVRHVPQRTTWHPATDSLMLAHTEQGQVFYSCEILVFLDLMMSVSMTSFWGHGWNGWYWKVWLADNLLFLELLL